MLLAAIKDFRTVISSPDDKLYVLEVPSRHGNDKMYEIFPKLRDLNWLVFIDSWKEYDTLGKSSSKFISPSYDFKPDVFKGMRTFMKTYFVLNPAYKSVIQNVDTKTGILVHYRLGDKMKLLDSYLVMKPSYFNDNLKRMLEKHDGPVYLVSDSPRIAHALLPNAILLDVDWKETFFLLSKFKRAILSESTFGVAATSLNFTEHETVFPAYMVDIKTMKTVDFSWGTMFKYETNKKYRAKLISDLKPLQTYL
jgi:hypothetical protein